jgi:CheY-like chemotaxis protein
MTLTDQSVTIVLVEDDPGHAKLIEKNLERAGIGNKVIKFTNGQNALDFFNELADNDISERYLMLLDLNLPIVDGFEVLEQLKKNPKTKAIPIVILTTTDNPREIDRCYAMGCNIYLTKPIGYEGFCEAIKKLGMMLAVVKVPHPQMNQTASHG